MATKTTTATPADTIAQHDAEIAKLNGEFIKYGNVHPFAVGAGAAIGGNSFDSTRLRAKFALAAQIDRLSIRREAARAEEARERLDGLADASDLAAMEMDVAECAVAVAHAEDAMKAARVALSTATAALAFRRERVAATVAAIAEADRAKARWERELEIDTDRLANVEKSAMLMATAS